MVYVPAAEAYGFSLRLNEDVMREVLTSDAVKDLVATEGEKVRSDVVAHIQATATPEDAANYVESMFMEDAFSDEYGFRFDGPYALGDRPIAVIGVHGGRGPDPAAKPPMLLEAQHHALTLSPGVHVGDGVEDIR